MDTLRNLFGNFTATLLRLALVVGTLAAVYLFIVKPTLDTTEEISRGAFEQSSQTQENIQRSIQRQIRQTNRQVQRSINQSVRQTKRPGGAKPQQLLNCVQRAGRDVQRIQACARKY